MVHVSASAMARLVDGQAHELTRPVIDDPVLRAAWTEVELAFQQSS